MPREPNQRVSRSEGPYSLQSTASTTAPARHSLLNIQSIEADEALYVPPHTGTISRQAVPVQVASGVRLSREQNEILATVLKGKNVFFTGPAGTGKSVLLKAIIRELRRTKPLDSIAVTATTGVASLAISGQTLHSHGGIGHGNEVAEILVKKLNRSRKYKSRWRSTQVWIIDEISMLKAELFDKLEYIARCIRDDPRPFGGIQLVLAGDFFQLPPVSKKGSSRPPDYAFSAKSWNTCIRQPFFLERVFRQKDDDFISLLSAMRVGSLTEQHKLVLQSLERPLICNADVQPAILLSSKKKVEQHNMNQLERLPGGAKNFFSMDSAGWDVYRKPLRKADAQKVLNSITLAPSKLTLKVGAQIMLIQNVIQNVLVNGSMGKIVEFITIREARKRDILISQPQSGDSEISEDLDSEDGLDYDEDANWQKPPTRPRRYQHRTYIEERILASYQDDPTIPQRPTQLMPITADVFLPPTDEYPLVHFANDFKMLCVPTFFDQVGIMGNIEARRAQVPLILSWAITIHKAQGQTLDYVKVDFSNIFAEGQAYVAVSRAMSMEGLQLVNFRADKVFANSRVREWHKYWKDWWNDKRKQQPEEVSTQLSATGDDNQVEDDYDSYNTEIPASWLEGQTLC